MAAGDIDPVIIPVRVAPDLSDFRTIEDAMRRARDLPGIGPSAAQAGAGSPAGMAGADAAATLSVRTLVREFQTLEGTLRTVNVQLERLGRQVVAMPGAGGGAAGTTMPPLPGGGAGVPGGAPSGGGGGLPPGGRPGAGTFDASQMLASMLYGSAGVLGVGLGIGAAFSQVSRMISESRTFQESAFLAAQGGQGDPVRTAAAISRGILTPPPGSTYLAPSDAAVAASARLQQLGLPETGRGREYAEFGQQTGTPAAAIGAEVYQTFRKEKGLEFEVAARQVARDTGQGTAEVVDQLRQLIRMMARGEGTYQRTGPEMEATAALLRTLGMLPGGVGKGPGGMAIVESVSSAMEGGGIGGLIAMSAFQREHPGVNLATPAGMQAFEEYRQTKANAIKVLKESQLRFGSDPNVRALVMERAFGVRADVAGQLNRGEITLAQAMALPTDEGAAADIQERNKGAVKAPGGEAFMLERWLATQRQQDTWASRAERGVEYGIGTIGPTATAAVGIAASLGIGAGTYMGGRGIVRALAPRIRRVGFGRFLGRGLGGASIAYDAYQAATGRPDWWGIGGGVAGGVAGGILGIAGGPLGIAGGALTGYGLGSGGGRALGGIFGASSAEASLGPSARETERGLGGWRRDEVLEHLALMRGLVMAPHMGGGTGTPDYGRAIPGGGSASSARVGAHAARLGGLPPALASGMETTAEKIMRMAGPHLDGGSAQSSRDIVPYGDDISVEGRILPNDPRIVEAAQRFGIPLKVFQALVRQESGFHVNARGRSGEYGLTQLLPGTAREMGVEHPMEPGENLRGGAGYLRKQLDYFRAQGMSESDAMRHALEAYNAGRENAKKPGFVSDYPPAKMHLSEADFATITPGPQASRAERRRAIEERVLASHAPETAAPEVRVHLELDQEIQGLVAARMPREGSFERSSR